MMVGKTKYFLCFPRRARDSGLDIFTSYERAASDCMNSSAHTETSFAKMSEFVNAGEDVVPDAYESTQHLEVRRRRR